MSTSATEVSIHAVSPLSSLGAAAAGAAGAAASAAGAAGAGAAAAGADAAGAGAASWAMAGTAAKLRSSSAAPNRLLQVLTIFIGVSSGTLRIPGAAYLGKPRKKRCIGPKGTNSDQAKL